MSVHLTYIPISTDVPIYHAVKLDDNDEIVVSRGYFFQDMRQPAPQCMVGPYPSVLAASAAGQRRLEAIEQE